MKPQRQMAMHLITAFKNRSHVVLESPTGTGKSASILCTALAWQRYQAKLSGEVVKIIYCSRTHSQVGQMVASLKKTPYRPRMAIIGSRGRFCINKGAKGSDGDGKQLSNFCQSRVRNTGLQREKEGYDDDIPPTVLPGDYEWVADEQEVQDVQLGLMHDGSSDEIDRKPPPKTCRHYRQLTGKKLANNAHSTFVPDNERLNMCTLGGEEIAHGSHDIEDLVTFGKQPNIRRNVAIYRGSNREPLGMILGKKDFCHATIDHVVTTGACGKEGTLQKGDALVTVNGNDITTNTQVSDVKVLLESNVDPLVIDAYRGAFDGLNARGNDEEAACPYFLSRALASTAELLFCPYNYVLDPSIRNALGLSIENTIVVLDEAHNIESILRDLGSGEFSEIGLSKVLASLLGWSRWTLPKDASKSVAAIPEIAHALALFVKKIVFYLRSVRVMFEKDEGTICFG